MEHQQSSHQSHLPLSTYRDLSFLAKGWADRLGSEFEKPYMENLREFLRTEYKAKATIFPPKDEIFRALNFVDYDEVKVVILGQDPYHGEHQANGLAFAVENELCVKPPSLMNIFKEIASDLGVTIPKNSSLTGWAHQGVLLLNSVLTVRAHEAFSHRNKGWEVFTDRVIEELNMRATPVVFILWGSSAHQKSKMITNSQHVILKAVHPSPLSAHRGFFGCRHFSICNAMLEKNGLTPIDWAKTV